MLKKRRDYAYNTVYLRLLGPSYGVKVVSDFLKLTEVASQETGPKRPIRDKIHREE